MDELELMKKIANVIIEDKTVPESEKIEMMLLVKAQDVTRKLIMLVDGYTKNTATGTSKQLYPARKSFYALLKHVDEELDEFISDLGTVASLVDEEKDDEE